MFQPIEGLDKHERCKPMNRGKTMKLLRVTGGKEIVEVTKVVINITRKSYLARLRITRTYLYQNQPTGMARVGRISILRAKEN